jgi:hypothetical protein
MPISTFSTETLAAVLCRAQVFDPKKWDAAVSQSDSNELLSAVDQLFQALDSSGVSYLLVGGIAMLAYVEGRNAEDIDLIMRRPDLDDLAQMVITEENQDFARANYQGLQVDLLLAQNSLFEQVAQTYKTDIQWGNRRIPCATPEGLVILKFYALPSLYRQGKFDRAALYETDILQLAYNYNLALEPAIQMVDPHVIASDRSEIRDIAQDIERRRQRMLRAQSAQPEAPGSPTEE